jgi:hypothetical protein
VKSKPSLATVSSLSSRVEVVLVLVDLVVERAYTRWGKTTWLCLTDEVTQVSYSPLRRYPADCLFRTHLEFLYPRACAPHASLAALFARAHEIQTSTRVIP